MRSVVGVSLPGFSLVGLLLGNAALADMGPIGGAIGETKPIIDTRLRFEGVDQDPMAEEAEAMTLRARLGFETGKAWETSLLAEGEFVWPLKDDYNSTTNGHTLYPTVADPESYEFNRLQLANTSLPQTTLTLGRQRITLDDQRFVGNVGWRQNEQTFDAFRVVNKTVPNVTFDVTYLNQVNRVFGKESPQGRYEGDSFLGNVSYQFPIGKLTGFGYWLEFDPIAKVPAAVRDSSETFGLRFAGERPLSKFKVAYAASYATQQQYSDNPLNFDNDYYLLELTGTYRQYSLGLGLETLEGNGVKGFTTPLATLHKFQGWADKFLATPPNGIEDRYVNAGVLLKGVGALDTLGAQVSYHDYQAEHISMNYGSEFDVQVQAKWHRFLGTLKYGDYQADRLFTDTTKFWVQLEYVW
ncbi:MAG: alginate export family protein [Povalibacter sp.]